MKDNMVKERKMEDSLSESHATGKKTWQTPDLTESDYKETASDVESGNDDLDYS